LYELDIPIKKGESAVDKVINSLVCLLVDQMQEEVLQDLSWMIGCPFGYLFDSLLL
jgi:hypothetical protein